MNILIFIIIIIIISLFITYFIFLQKEKFISCNNVTKVSTSGVSSICRPYYGIPPANAINPYSNMVNSSGIYEQNDNERLKKNKDSIQKLCGADSHCTGFFINEKPDSTNEGYLCKHGWDGVSTKTVMNQNFNFQTYKCNDPNGGSINISDAEINIMDGNIISYKKDFNIKVSKKYMNYNFNDECVIKYPDIANTMAGEPIVYNLGYSNNDNLVELFNFANTMDTCIGFTIFKKSDNTYEAKFYQKIKDIDLKLIKNNLAISYVSIISDKKKKANRSHTAGNTVNVSVHYVGHEAALHVHNARINMDLYGRGDRWVMITFSPGNHSIYGFIAWGQHNDITSYKWGWGNEPSVDPGRDCVSAWLHSHNHVERQPPQQLMYILIKHKSETITEEILVDA